jgi:putative membrane protein
MSEVGLPLALVAAAAGYAFAVQRQWEEQPRRGWARPAAFLAGVVVVGAAVVSPLDAAAHRSLWVHMVQHVLLISAAAPLLALGRPVDVVRTVWSRPLPAIPKPGVWTMVTAAGGIQVVVLLLWHAPALYDNALANDALHGAEHLTLLVTAVALWSALDNVRGERGGLAVVALFVVSFPPLLLGAAMTFATTLWYRSYAAEGGRALTDQQIAGAVMWGYGGLAAVVGGVGLFVRWLIELERTTPSRPGFHPSDAPIDPTPSC